MTPIKPPHEVINRLQEALGLGHLKVTRIELVVGMDELCAVKVEYFAEDTQIESLAVILEEADAKYIPIEQWLATRDLLPPVDGATEPPTGS